MWKMILPVLAAVFAAGFVGAAGMPGGFMDVDPEDQGARDALDFAVAEHNKGSNDMYLTQVSDVVKVQRQVVAGYKYVITVRMGRTPCRKSNPDEACAIHEDPEKARPYQCTFTVYTRPWMSEITMLSEKC